MIVTGSSSSRLIELKKYTITNLFSQQYIGNGNLSNDGVDYNNSISGQFIVYYIGGIKYIDTIHSNSSTTIFSFLALGLNSNNSLNLPIYKDNNKEGIINDPKINNDIFIERQELSAFDLNYRLEFITNLSDLETYAAGKFFNIVKNT